MTEQRVATLVVEVAGRKSNLETVLRALQTELRATSSASDQAANRIGETLAKGNDKAARSTLQLLGAAQKLAQEELKTAQAASRAAAEQLKVDAAQNKTARSAQELARAEQQVALAEQQVALTAGRVATETARTEAAQSRAAQAALRLSQAQERANRQQDGGSFSSFLDGLGQMESRVSGVIGVLGGLGGAFAAIQVGAAAVDFARQGEAIAAAANSFDKLAASAGTSGEAILAALQKTAAGTVANADLIKSSNTALLLLGNDVASQLPQLLGIAKASATTLGADVGQLFDNLVTGIARGSTELLDNLGISISATEAYEQYAASLGKSADELTKAEKSTAVLNAVLAQGNDIIARAGGAADQGGVSFQRADAALANFTATAQVAAAQALAPLAEGFANAAAGGEQLIARLAGQGNAATQNAAQIAAAAISYQQYQAGIDGANAGVANFLAANQGLIASVNAFNPALGAMVVGLVQANAGTQALSESQLIYMQALVAQGVAAEEALARAEAMGAGLDLLDAALERTGGGLDAYRERLVTLGAQGDGQAEAVQNLVTAFLAEGITVEQLAAQLTALEEASARVRAAKEDDAAATGEVISATEQATIATNQSAAAKLEEEAAAALTAQRHRELALAVQEAASSSGSAIAAAAAIAGQFNGVEAPAIVNLINLHRQLKAARAGQDVATYVATQRGRDNGLLGGGNEAPGLTRAQLARIEEQKAAAYQRQLQDELTRATGSTADQLALVNQELAKAPKYSQEAMRLEIQKARLLQQQQREAEAAAKRGAGGAGGGANSDAKVKAAEREQQRIAENERKYQEQRLRDQEKINRELQEAEAEHYDKLLDIQAEYEEKNLAQQRENEVSKRKSRYSFYDDLTQSELPQDIQGSLSAAYEAAFAEASRLSQEGKSKLAADYLALKQEQIAAEQDYQEALAKAREDGDKAEVARLERLAQLRRDAEQEELKQLLEDGDTNVANRDEALAEESQRYQDEQNKIAGAAEVAAQRKLEATKQSIEGIRNETQALKEQADQLALLNQQKLAGGASSPTPGAPTATPADVGAPVGGEAAAPVAIAPDSVAALSEAQQAAGAAGITTLAGKLDRIADLLNQTINAIHDLGATRPFTSNT